MLAYGTLQAADRYRQAKRAAARVVTDTKTWTWKDFRKAMEEDYRSDPKKNWQTLCQRRLKQCSSHTVRSVHFFMDRISRRKQGLGGIKGSQDLIAVVHR